MNNLAAEFTGSFDALKTNQEIKGLNKNEAQQYSIKITDNYRKLVETLFDKDNGLLVGMQKQLIEQQKLNLKLLEKMDALEKQQIHADQYSRKETIEIRGLNENLPDAEIEQRVVQVLNAIKENNDAEFVKEDIHACHKLKNKKIVICKFVSRRRMRTTINNRKRLKTTDLTGVGGIQGKVVIYESMTYHYKNLHWKCMQLKKAQIIKDAWFCNGKFKVIRAGEVDPIVVTDIDNLSHEIQLPVAEINNAVEEWKTKPFPPRDR